MITLRKYIKPEIVRRLNPKYIGFLLNLYIPAVFNTVSSCGNPSRIEDPRRIKLNAIRNILQINGFRPI